MNKRKVREDELERIFQIRLNTGKSEKCQEWRKQKIKEKFSIKSIICVNELILARFEVPTMALLNFFFCLFCAWRRVVSDISTDPTVFISRVKTICP